MSDSASFAVRLDKIGKTYGKGHTQVQALQEVSFTVPTGSYWAIMGPSGSGKSTLLHLLGLLDRPSEGTLTVGGTDITPSTNLSDLSRLRSEHIGFVFQQFFLLPRLTAEENVMLPALYMGRSVKAARSEARSLLADVGLSGRIDHRPNELSGGEQQRVAIARALINTPVLILADEPTGNLDSKSGEAILELFDTLHGQGKTILIVTHEAEVGEHAQKVLRLKDGRLQ